MTRIVLLHFCQGRGKRGTAGQFRLPDRRLDMIIQLLVVKLSLSADREVQTATAGPGPTLLPCGAVFYRYQVGGDHNIGTSSRATVTAALVDNLGSYLAPPTPGISLPRPMPVSTRLRIQAVVVKSVTSQQ